MPVAIGRSFPAWLALSLAACTPASSSPAGTPADASGPGRTIEKARACRGGEMTYLGFRGTGQPPVALLDEILKRFPDAAVYEVGEGSLGVFVAEHHSMEVRARHEAAAAAVGWKGDVVDFASVTKTCEAAFHTPVPPPRPRLPRTGPYAPPRAAGVVSGHTGQVPHAPGRLIAVLVATLASAACSRLPAEPLDLRVTGCARMRAGPVCEVGDGPVRVWSEHAAVRVSADRGEPTVASEERGSGWLHRVSPPPGATRLEFAVEDGAIRRTRSLALAAAEPEPPAVVAARARRRAGELDAAVRAAEVVRRSGAARDRVWAGSELGRALLAVGRVDEAADVLATSAREHAEAGDLSESVRDTIPRVMALRLGHRLPEARAALASIPPLSLVDAASVAEVRYVEGMLDVSAGAAARALGAFAEAERRYVELGMPLEARMVGQQRAVALLALGRAAEAASALAGHAAVVPGERGCDRVDVLAHEAWAALLTGELDAEAAPDAASRAASALDQALGVPCADTRRQAELRRDRARVAHLAGDADEATRHLAGARAAHERPDATLSADARVVSARIALARGDAASATAAADELVTLQEAAGDADALAQALDLRARARLRGGATGQAREDAEGAEALVDVLSRTVALGEGAAAFFSGHARVTATRIAVELAAGDPAAALSASRRARRRLLSRSDRVAHLAGLSPQARAAWESALGVFRRERDALAEDAARDGDRSVAALEASVALRRRRSAEALSALDRAAETLLGPPPSGLAAPAPGEVWLSALVTPERAFAFAHSTSGVRALDLAPAPAGELSSRIVSAFRVELARARRIVVVASGALGAVDWHALPLPGFPDERPLLAFAPVEYAKDLAPRTPDVAVPSGPPVVVGDPTGDLPSAAREASAVAAALAAFSPVVVRGKQADRARILGALGSTSFLHYAGHGVFAGRDGEESRLPLAGGALAVPDLLALPRAPRGVVLSGCDTARGAGAETADAYGLATAFLTAGAERVVAASRPVDDALAERFMRELHADVGPATAPLPDPASAARRAALAVRAELPGADWTAFRVLRRLRVLTARGAARASRSRGARARRPAGASRAPARRARPRPPAAPRLHRRAQSPRRSCPPLRARRRSRAPR